MSKSQLTEKQYWEDCWDKIRLPAIVEPDTKHTVAKKITNIILKEDCVFATLLKLNIWFFVFLTNADTSDIYLFLSVLVK